MGTSQSVVFAARLVLGQLSIDILLLYRTQNLEICRLHRSHSNQCLYHLQLV